MKRLLIAFAAAAIVVALGGPAAAQDEMRQGMSTLAHSLASRWKPDCSIPLKSALEIRFKITPNGSILSGPTWSNPVADTAMQNAADRAIKVIASSQPYIGLPAPIYDKVLSIEFDQATACGQTR